MSANVTGGFTRIGSALFAWEPFRELDDSSRIFWLCLYANPHVKKLPGLCYGSIRNFADHAGQQADTAIRSLDVLLDRELVEYDTKNRVLRLCELPDAGDWPQNGSILRSWWKNFRMVPECDVRDAHVQTVWWLIERGALESESNKSGKVSQQHAEIWSDTFGKVKIPPPRRRGVRRLADADTSTAVQPSLFAPSGASGSGCEQGAPTTGSPLPVDNSAPISENPKSKDFNTPGTVPARSGEGEGVGAGVGAGSGARPVLALVPPPGPFTVADLARAFAGPRWPQNLGEPLTTQLARAIGSLPPGTTLADLDVLRDHVLHGGASVTPEHLATPGALAAVLERSAAWKRDCDERSAAMAEIRARLGGP